MNKNTDISERILEFIDYIGITRNDFAKSLGYTRSQVIYDIVNGKAKPSFDFFDRLVNSEYSETINLDWLISGRGEMSKENIVKKEDLDSITNSITFTGETKSLENVIHSVNESRKIYNSTTGIPLIPIDAMAGFGTGEIQVMDYDTEKYNVPEFTELNVDFMIRVKGSSMYPKYNSGDLVACKKLFISDMFFQWNKVYVLDTAQGALIKRIKKGKDQEHVLIVSDNPKYDPFELHLSKINAVAIVLGVIRLE